MTTWAALLLSAANLWLLLCSLVSCAPHGDLITSLPGQPAVSFAQYSGYITINASAGRSFFYYFVEAPDNPSAKPLTLWLNGGPGCSSIGNGAFTENGPFRVTLETGTLIENIFSWNKVSNILYLDSPAGVGWSYSNTSADLVANDVSTAKDNFIFLQNWFDAFPEYKGRDFYITGESYAGHYAPQLAAHVVDYMAEFGTSVINLVAVGIGNPLLDGLVDFPEEIFFEWTHGLISDSTYANVMSSCNFSVVAVPNKECSIAIGEADRELSDFIDPYNVLVDVCLSPRTQQEKRLKRSRKAKVLQSTTESLDVCIDDELLAYMNLPTVQKAFHANVTGLPYRWNYCNDGSLDYDESAEDESILHVLSHILKGGVSILVYSGDEDTVIPFSGTRRLINQLAEMNNLSTTIPYSVWFDGGQVGGWTQVYGPLSYATVRGAAHMVPFSSPRRAFTLFESFIGGVSMPLYPLLKMVVE